MSKKYLDKGYFVGYPDNSEQFKYCLNWTKTEDAKKMESIVLEFVREYMIIMHENPIYRSIYKGQVQIDSDCEASSLCEVLLYELMENKTTSITIPPFFFEYPKQYPKNSKQYQYCLDWLKTDTVKELLQIISKILF